MTENLNKLIDKMNLLREEVGRVIIGYDDVMTKALIVILTRNHALVEGVPGIAKTLLVRTLAHVLGCSFSRIQFTPDLMPTDITGTNVFNLQRNDFTLVKGPIFTHFLLADEINRAPAKTQSALLQAMQERTVSIDRDTYELPHNFTVFATQNPIEFEGTYPLPEAQKDRFMLKINVDYPEPDAELLLAKRMLGRESPENILESGTLKVVFSDEELLPLQETLQEISFREELITYLVTIIRKTRTHPAILAGASPRASQALVLASRCMAALSSRDFVTPDDIKQLTKAVLEHRLILRPEFEIEGLRNTDVIREILEEIPIPR